MDLICLIILEGYGITIKWASQVSHLSAKIRTGNSHPQLAAWSRGGTTNGIQLGPIKPTPSNILPPSGLLFQNIPKFYHQLRRIHFSKFKDMFDFCYMKEPMMKKNSVDKPVVASTPELKEWMLTQVKHCE